MKMAHLWAALAVLVFASSIFCCAKNDAQDSQNNQAPQASESKEATLLKGITKLVNSTVRIERDKVIYIDPYKINGTPHDADVIFITHPHADHFSPDDIAKIKKADTTLVIPESCKGLTTNLGLKEIVTVVPSHHNDQQYQVKGIQFTVPEAYNLDKEFHKKSDGWAGYVLNLGGTTYYFAGDTDKISGMEQNIYANVVFLPVGGKYTMNSAEAAQLANLMKPDVAVPYHYGSAVGTEQDAVKFIQALNKGIIGVRYDVDGKIVK